MQAAKTRDLGGGYALRTVPPPEFTALLAQLEPQLFGGRVHDLSGLPTVAMPSMQEFTCVIQHGTEIAGLHRARQEDERTVHMSITALLPQHRGKGVYTRLLAHLLAEYAAAGYTFVTSMHHPTNNAVLIPKLRAGFVIQGMQMTRAGLMVQLLYSFDEAYREYLAQLCRHGAR